MNNHLIPIVGSYRYNIGVFGGQNKEGYVVLLVDHRPPPATTHYPTINNQLLSTRYPQLSILWIRPSHDDENEGGADEDKDVDTDSDADAEEKGKGEERGGGGDNNNGEKGNGDSHQPVTPAPDLKLGRGLHRFVHVRRRQRHRRPDAIAPRLAQPGRRHPRGWPRRVGATRRRHLGGGRLTAALVSRRVSAGPTMAAGNWTGANLAWA